MDNSKTISAVQRSLEEITDSARKTGVYRDREWTRQIKRRICELGLAAKCEVNAAGCDGATDGEWMFDLAWSRSRGSRFVRLLLILESEWSTRHHEILRDFGKLVVAKADLKVFVFQQRTDELVEKMMKVLCDTIEDFEVKVPGEAYLLAGYGVQSGNFSFKHYRP